MDENLRQVCVRLREAVRILEEDDDPGDAAGLLDAANELLSQDSRVSPREPLASE